MTGVSTSVSIPCSICAKAGKACCLGRQIVLTTGDLERIFNVLGRHDFFTMEPPDPWFLEPGYDPEWVPLVTHSDGLLRVLKRNGEKNCEMLTASGCSLPTHARPLVCQLHPYMHSEAGILGIDATCPISQDAKGFATLKALGMPLENARHWCATLYAELKEEKMQALAEFCPPFTGYSRSG